jgi:hypothetical protein
MRYARLHLIARISANRTSQISIFESSSACVVLLAVNNLDRVFAA